MVQKIFLFISTIYLIQGCNINTSGTWKNANIENSKRDEIKTLNDKLFNAIENNDAASLRTIMADSLIKQGANINQILEQASNRFKANSYTILDEYYIQNSTTNVNNTIPPALSGDNDYSIYFLALNKDMYVSLLLINTLNNKALIMAVYGLYKNGWKLNILRIGQYDLFKKNAIDYYKLAKSSYDKAYLIDAYDNLNLSQQLLKPADDNFIYQKEKDINELYDKVRNDLNTKYSLPLTLENVSTKPKIFRIYPQIVNEGYYPMVQYLTNVNIKDTILLKQENEKVKKEVNAIFNGIDKDKKYIFYQAFNKLPDRNEAIERYGFVDQLTK